MTTANLQEEKKGDYLPTTEFNITRPPVPWWVLLYFSKHETIVHNEYQAVFTKSNEQDIILGYFIWFDSFTTCWYIRVDFLYEDKIIDPLFTSPIFSFPLPPTDVEFRTIMNILDIK
ncbi:MAG: hypothetical protein ACKV1O_31080 [Saprospiraceae bacterium]